MVIAIYLIIRAASTRPTTATSSTTRCLCLPVLPPAAARSRPAAARSRPAAAAPEGTLRIACLAAIASRKGVLLRDENEMESEVSSRLRLRLSRRRCSLLAHASLQRGTLYSSSNLA